MVKWNEKEIVDGIASKYNKIARYTEKYKSAKRNILRIHERHKMYFALSMFTVC